MQRTKKTASGTGKVILALLIGVSLPVLIWVALGAALHKKTQERKSRQAPAPTIGEILKKVGLTIQEKAADGKPVPAKTFAQQPASEICKLVARAGLTIQEETAPRHCWEVLDCPPEKRDTCPDQSRHEIPRWAAIGMSMRK